MTALFTARGNNVNRTCTNFTCGTLILRGTPYFTTNHRFIANTSMVCAHCAAEANGTDDLGVSSYEGMHESDGPASDVIVVDTLSDYSRIQDFEDMGDDFYSMVEDATQDAEHAELAYA